MKMLKTVTLGAIALSTIGAMSAADTVIKITGSTAFRAATYAAIVNTLPSPKVVFFGNSSLAKASQATFVSGTAGNQTIVQCCFAGSVGGINWLVNNTNVATSLTALDTQAWLKTTGATAVSTSGSGTGLTFVGGAQAATATYDDAAPANVTMSDSLQDSTAFDSGTTGVTLIDTQVGIVPFAFIKGLAVHPSITNAGSLTNISPLAFQALASSGKVPMSWLTGASTDVGYDVLLAGRDSDSGTRLAAFAETAFGVFSTPTQYIVNGSYTATSSAAVTINNVTAINDADLGIASGGTVKNLIASSISATATDAAGKLSTATGYRPYMFVSYVGIGDVGTNTKLTYAGVPYTEANVQNGLYTFWTYEHLLYRSDIDSTVKTSVDAIAVKLKSTYANVSGILDDANMKVKRYSEGGSLVSK